MAGLTVVIFGIVLVLSDWARGEEMGAIGQMAEEKPSGVRSPAVWLTTSKVRVFIFLWRQQWCTPLTYLALVCSKLQRLPSEASQHNLKCRFLDVVQ